MLTPIKRPRESSNGPPEFYATRRRAMRKGEHGVRRSSNREEGELTPGLIAASLCMQPLMGLPPTPSTSLPNADTTPVVNV